MGEQKFSLSRRSFASGACGLTLFGPGLAHAAQEKTTVTYRTVEGHNLLVDVYRSQTDQPRPVIVWFHGGALIMGSREWLLPQMREVAERMDFGLLSFDYRLAPETKLPGIITDMEAAFRWLADEGAKRFRLDPNRMVVAGGSAGGYLALLAGYRARPRPKAVVSLFGYGRLNEDWYAKPNLYPEYNRKKFTPSDLANLTRMAAVSDDPKGAREPIYLYYRQTGLWPREVSGFPPDSITQELAAYEPARNVTRAYPPTLLIHGTEDHDVPYAESENMAALFRRHGVPYLFKTIDKAGHGLQGGDKAQIDDAYRAMQEFVAKYL